MKKKVLGIALAVALFALGWVIGAYTQQLVFNNAKNNESSHFLLPTPLPKNIADISPLFAPPSASELAAVQAQWAKRDISAQGWKIEKQGQWNGSRFWVISHLVEGKRHYGLVRFPGKYQAGKKFAVVIYNHAGNNGATIDTIRVLETQLLPSNCLAEHAFLLMPSFRGEPLQAADFGTYQSEGQKSILDGDVDDALAMLNSVLQNIPEADEENIKAWGVSRGGGVSLLMSIRDKRIKAVVDDSAESDLLLSSIQEQIQRSVDYNIQPINPVHIKVMEIVQAYLLGEISLATARMELIQSSVVYFADQLPSLQIHHGAKDIIIPVEHSQRLYQALQALERPENIAQELYIYPQGDHNMLSLVGSGERIERFLCQ